MSRLFLTFIFLAGAFLLGVLYLRPEWQRFQDMGHELTELEEISREFDELIGSRDRLLGLINSISKENLERVDRMLPQGPHASDFLVSLEALTVQSGMALRRIDLVSPEGERKSEALVPRAGAGGAAAGQPKPGGPGVAPPRAAKETQTLPFNLQVAGSYGALKKFLESTERNLRLIDVEGISFSASGKGEASEFTIKAKTYYQ